MSQLAFLHTAAVHVASFDALLRELAPHTRARHLVREDLLATARRLGADAPEVAKAVNEAVRDAAAGAQVVLCTCSTIGAVAEASATARGTQVLRIDRPMAEEALRIGSRITVAAALASTLQPTVELLSSVAIELGRPLHVDTVLVPQAWTLFEQGDLNGFYISIATALAAVRECDVIVLAQASMAGALEHCAALGVPALASPLTGVRAALARLG